MPNAENLSKPLRAGRTGARAAPSKAAGLRDLVQAITAAAAACFVALEAMEGAFRGVARHGQFSVPETAPRALDTSDRPDLPADAGGRDSQGCVRPVDLFSEITKGH